MELIARGQYLQQRKAFFFVGTDDMANMTEFVRPAFQLVTLVDQVYSLSMLDSRNVFKAITRRCLEYLLNINYSQHIMSLTIFTGIEEAINARSD